MGTMRTTPVLYGLTDEIAMALALIMKGWANEEDRGEPQITG